MTIQQDCCAHSTEVPSKRELKRRRKERRRMYERALLPPPVPWDEDQTSFDQHLFLDAATFSQMPVFDIPPAKNEQITDEGRYVISPNRTFAYQNRVLHVGTPLDLHGHGHVMFSDDVVIPTLIDLNRDYEGIPFDEETGEAERVFRGNVWMSLTPNEMMSQRDGIEVAQGTVVVGGLGLGWFIRKVCEKQCVEKVIVVDYSQELLDWYGYDLCANFPKVSNVICDDIYGQIGRYGDETTYLLDIWPTQEAVNEDPDFCAAKRELGDRLWGWGWRESES